MRYKIIFINLLILFFSNIVYAGPVILYQDVITGPKSGTNDGPGGSYLTLFGKGFGATKESSTVTIGGGAVGDYKYWSDTKVSVQLGSSCTTGSIVLTTESGSATAPESFTVSSGNIYFISPDGDDDTGIVNDINHPFFSPNYIRSSLSAGDWIVAKGGTYDVSDADYNWGGNNDRWLNLANKAGTATQYITIMGYPGEAAHLEVTNASYSVLYYPMNNTNYTAFCNFYVDVPIPLAGYFIKACEIAQTSFCDSTDPASHNSAQYARVVNIDIDGKSTGLYNTTPTNGGVNAIYVGYSKYVKIWGCKVHDSYPNGTSASHMIYLGEPQRYTDIGWNQVYNIWGSRAIIQAHHDEYAPTCVGKYISDIYIHNNIIHDVNGQPILMDGGDL